MTRLNDLPQADFEAWLAEHQTRTLLRFITCGSVDDGKSTLIGRLLFDTQQLQEDLVAAAQRDSRRYGTQGDALDLALLVDGLAAEREQGITIDVAWRYFQTPRRSFIVADTPGHVQYTRNMVTGASTADAAVLLVDARHGLLTQTRRHGQVLALMGVHQVVLAVNKMDLVAEAQPAFQRIEAEFMALAESLGFTRWHAVPVSALHGHMIVHRGSAMPWYRGPTLLECLDGFEPGDLGLADGPLRLPVQSVMRSPAGARAYCGMLASGRLRPGDAVRVLPAGTMSHVRTIRLGAAELPAAVAGQSVSFTLTDEIDLSRGDLITAAEQPAEVADQFEAHLVWLSQTPLLPGRSYSLMLGTQLVGAAVTQIKYRQHADTFEHLAARQLELNDIAVCNLALDRPLPFDPYRDNRQTGGFILIDRTNWHTVGAGMLHFALRRSQNIHPQALSVGRDARAALKQQRPAVLWFTGLSGAGKSTIANRVDQRLLALGRHCVLLDGDNLRHGLNRDLGFSDADRVENIRRVAEVARLMADAGLIVLTAFISPFRAERALARARIPQGEFFEIHVDVPMAVAEARDVKGLYAKARRGELRHFTGIDSPYEAPLAPELVIDTTRSTAESAAETIVELLRARGHLDGPL